MLEEFERGTLLQGVKILQQRVAGLPADKLDDIEQAYYDWLHTASQCAEEFLELPKRRRYMLKKSDEIYGMNVQFTYDEMVRDLRMRSITNAFLCASTGDTFAYSQLEYDGYTPFNDEDCEDSYY